MAASIFGMWLFRSTLHIGFLLDDFYHLDYLIRAFSGHPEAVTHLLWSNWSPDTTLTSYRPLVSFSLAADYALWAINAYGYHLTNLLLFGGCVALIAYIAREVCLAFETGNEDAVGIGAALLFAAYPLHPEAVAWIIGRVDVLSTFLTFASTLFYMLSTTARFASGRLIRAATLAAAVAFFVLAMMTKEMAVTLPVVLSAFEIFRAKKVGKPPTAIYWMWGTLVVFAVWRTLILGTVVGGYGGTGWRTVKQGWKNFRDVPTLVKLFYGANEELQLPATLGKAVLGLAACSLLRFQPKAWRAYAFLFCWTFLTILPTFQIWHIWPNLVGSRLFYMGSGPLCILLAILFLSAGRKWQVIAGGIVCGALALTWTSVLEENLQPWTGAAQRLGALRARLQQEFPKLSQQYKIFIPILPQDFKGAPILGRPEYLSILCKPPFADKDYTDYILTAEPIIAGGEEYVGPQVYADANHQAKETIVVDQNDYLLNRVKDTAEKAPIIRLSPQGPLTLKERFNWLHHHRNTQSILDYDCAPIPGAVSAKVYISKAWQPFSNAPRGGPPDPQFVEREIGPVPPHSSAILPQMTPGVHDVAVMAFDKDNKPVGIMSETVSVNSPAAERKTAQH